MYLTGFADEAGTSIETQIKATQELGWTNIESRNIDGVNIHDLSDEAFDAVVAKLEAAGVSINCFGSAIANWACQVTSPFEETLVQIERTIPRMQRLGCKLIRIMSYAVLKDEDGKDLPDQMKEERFRRVREMVRLFTEAGITPVHENCMNYGGMSYQHSLELIENAPGLKLVFDTGNPVFTDDRSKPAPYPKQSAWEFYSKVKEHIAYVHIKDALYCSENPGGVFPKSNFTFAGEGDGDVKRIVKDLMESGYDGGISMEPHLAVVFHDDSQVSSDEVKYSNYVEYGRRFEALLKEVAPASL
jgi:sugar phosphate isomerase/epimerase